MHARGGKVGLDRPVHEIGAARPVGMEVDEARSNIKSVSIHYFHAGRPRLLPFGKHPGDPPVFHEETPLPGAVRQEQPAIDNQFLHCVVIFSGRV